MILDSTYISIYRIGGDSIISKTKWNLFNPSSYSASLSFETQRIALQAIT